MIELRRVKNEKHKDGHYMFKKIRKIKNKKWNYIINIMGNNCGG